MGAFTVDLSNLAAAVAAGESLSLRLTLPDGVEPGCAWLRDTGDAYAGGEEIRDGVSHPETDLAFRVLVR